MKSSSYKMGSMSGENKKKKNFILQNKFNYIVLVFCIVLLKADYFIMACVAHLNDVAHWPLFYSLDSS